MNGFQIAKIGFASTIEWLEFALFGFLASCFSYNFFVSDNDTVAWIKTFSLIFVGFISRPIGGLFFGFLGDKRGRSYSLKITPIFIALMSLLISIMPTYRSVGIIAPYLLVFIRFLQGFFIGGEYAGNTLYLCELGKGKYYLGSLASCCGSLGILIASLLSAFLYHYFGNDWMTDIGWRVAYFITSVLGLISIFLRRNLKETPVFTNLIESASVSNSPLKEVLVSEKIRITISLMIICLHASSFYFVFTYLPNFLKMEGNFQFSGVLGVFSICLMTRLIFIPIIGKLADKTSGEWLLFISSVVFFLFSPLLFNMLSSNDDVFRICAIAIFSFFTAVNASIVPGLLSKILKPRTGYTGFSIAMNVGFGFFGGIVPLMSHALSSYSDIKNPGFYISLCSVITIIGIFLVKRNGFYEELSGDIKR
jgi:MHS family proline/betaine transporter-like MFS transporter